MFTTSTSYVWLCSETLVPRLALSCPVLASRAACMNYLLRDTTPHLDLETYRLLFGYDCHILTD